MSVRSLEAAAVFHLRLASACAGGQQRNLIPCEQIDMHSLIQEHYLTQPLQVPCASPSIMLINGCLLIFIWYLASLEACYLRASYSSSGKAIGSPTAHSVQPVRLQVRAGAVAWPHPEKVAQGKAKAVNRKQYGWAGEDAYFYAQSR